MGKMRWMSKGARRKGVNLRAPATATSQASYTTTVSWTPVFAHGRVKIYTCDARLTAAAATAPRKLNGSAHAALFVSSVLPKILEEMKEKYEWTTVPRVIVHDKASYFSSTALTLPLHAACVKVVFGVGLAISRQHTVDGSQVWRHVLHETCISHIRRLLGTTFASSRILETAAQFRRRLNQVEDFKLGEDGSALERLCRDLIRLKGAGLPK